MSITAQTSTIAVHVEAAKRLLRELEQQAETALNALGRDSSADFFAAVDARDQILGQLDGVVNALTSERQAATESQTDKREMASLFAEIARAATTALESHDRLTSETRRERDRLAQALRRTAKPDPVARQYGASKPRARTISVTG